MLLLEQLLRENVVLIVFLTVVLIGVIIFMAIRARRLSLRKIYCGACYSTFTGTIVNISGRSSIPYNLIPLSLDNTFFYSVWVYVSNWYYNMKKWKHVFHTGSSVAPGCATDLAWNQINYQCPGLWLKPIVNDLRLVVQTNTIVPPQCESLFGAMNPDAVLTTSAATCPALTAKASTSSNAMGINVQAYQQANPETTSSCQAGSPSGTTSMPLLEYVDVQNIPIGTWFQVGINVIKNQVEIYVDGKLATTQLLLGQPVINQGSVSFGVGGSYSGYVSNFHYAPQSLDYQTILALFQKESAIKRTKMQ